MDEGLFMGWFATMSHTGIRIYISLCRMSILKCKLIIEDFFLAGQEHS